MVRTLDTHESQENFNSCLTVQQSTNCSTYADMSGTTTIILNRAYNINLSFCGPGIKYIYFMTDLEKDIFSVKTPWSIIMFN